MGEVSRARRVRKGGEMRDRRRGNMDGWLGNPSVRARPLDGPPEILPQLTQFARRIGSFLAKPITEAVNFLAHN